MPETGQLQLTSQRETSRKYEICSTRENRCHDQSDVSSLGESIQDKISKFSEMMSAMKDMENKHVKQYTCLFSDSAPVEGPNRKKSQWRDYKNRKRKERKQKKNKKQRKAKLEANRKTH